MEFLASPLGVFLILAVVTIAAFSFEPAGPVGHWKELATLYGADQQPTSVAFNDVSIVLGDPKSVLAGLARVDVALDDEFLWILSTEPAAKKQPVSLKIPWDCVRYRQAKGDKQNFQLRGKDPIELWVSTDLGNAMQRRSLRFEIEDQL